MVTTQGLRANGKIFLLISVLTGVFLGAGYLLGGTGGMIIGLLIAGVMNIASYWFSDRIVLKMYGAEEIKEEENPEIHQMVEKLASNAGIPKPRIYRSSMQVPNAFATGRNPEKGVVCVTDGLMNSLNQEEIEGVIAHELAHIRNRDTLINTAVATVAGALGFLAEMAFWGAMFGGREEDGEMISALALMIITPLIATVIRLAVSRSMEYRADAHAVQIHGQKQGLSSALKKINRASSGPQRRHVNRSQEAAANLFIENPFSSHGITKWFSTHPALHDRLKNIEKTEL
ncbi:M48 family metalloprotease [Candidatus Nanohaloarchaea archaeon]|nr:M48 family metalloprotease [Candidatus Nanohaloarchaea archaeon]